jgi:hypothetical protein
VDDGMQVQGLMGTLSADEVHQGLEPRMGRFMRCFERRYGALELLGGQIRFAFRIATDGSVREVHARESTIGDRQTERCLLEVAQSARFARPQGGEAEFAWPIEVDPLDDVRPPLYWEQEQVADVVAENASSVRSCGRGPFVVTVYIAPGGSVMAAGSAATGGAESETLDCVAEAVSAWSMPDPGSYAAKVTFEVN